MSKILFDANVLLDFFLERNSQPEKIERLFSFIDNKTVEGYVTLSILYQVVFPLFAFVQSH